MIVTKTWLKDLTVLAKKILWTPSVDKYISLMKGGVWRTHEAAGSQIQAAGPLKKLLLS